MTDKTPKSQNFLGLFLTTLVVFAAATVTIMYLSYKNDPFHFYKAPDDRTALYDDNHRYRAPSLSKHFEHDTLVMGTSLTGNFKPEMFERSDWNILKNNVGASSVKLQRHLVQEAINNFDVKRVVLEVSFNNLSHGRDYNDKVYLPDYLYNTTLETPFIHLLSFDALKQKFSGYSNNLKPVDELGVWWEDQAHTYGPAAYSFPVRIKSCAPLSPTKDDPAAAYKEEFTSAINDQLVPLLKDNPKVDFSLWFPPYSTIWHYTKNSKYEQHLYFRTALVSALKDIDNATLYDFANWESVSNNPRMFRDPYHFDLESQSTIAKAIGHSDKKWQVDLEGWNAQADPYIETIRKFDYSVHHSCGGEIGAIPKEELEKRAKTARTNMRKFAKSNPVKAKEAFEELDKVSRYLPKQVTHRISLAEAMIMGWGTEKKFEEAGKILFHHRFNSHRKVLYLRGIMQTTKGSPFYDMEQGMRSLTKAESKGYKAAGKRIQTLKENKES